MTDASTRAREILDAIERDAADRQAALGGRVPASDATPVAPRAPEASGPPAAPRPPAPVPFSPPPFPASAPAVASPIVAPLSAAPAPATNGGSTTVANGLPASLRAHIVTPAAPAPAAPPAGPAPAATPAPAAADDEPTQPPTHEAARLLALVDHVVEQTKNAQERLQTLDTAVSALSVRLGVEGDAEPVPPAPKAKARAKSKAPKAAAAAAEARESAGPVPTVTGNGNGDGVPAHPRTDGARLVAIEMAVGGFSRGEVQDRLVREYGLAEPRTILDDVFGPGSDDASRMPWGAV